MLLHCFLSLVGDHGYDNSLSSMHPFLAATGPSFRQGYRISSLQSVDIYPLMCHLLSIPPQPNNGTLTQARCLLAAETCGDTMLVIGLVVGAQIALITIIGKFVFLCYDIVPRSICVTCMNRLRLCSHLTCLVQTLDFAISLKLKLQV